MARSTALIAITELKAVLRIWRPVGSRKECFQLSLQSGEALARWIVASVSARITNGAAALSEAMRGKELSEREIHDLRALTRLITARIGNLAAA